MLTSTEILQHALDGWRERGDIEKYVNLEDIAKVEPLIIEAHKQVESAGRNLELIIKGAILERDC